MEMIIIMSDEEKDPRMTDMFFAVYRSEDSTISSGWTVESVNWAEHLQLTVEDHYSNRHDRGKYKHDGGPWKYKENDQTDWYLHRVLMPLEYVL